MAQASIVTQPKEGALSNSSAPVGVEAREIAEYDQFAAIVNALNRAGESMERAVVLARGVAATLAQQPAAVDRARFRKAPCYLCGYNGPGYFQPETHPCAALYHAAQPPAEAQAQGGGEVVEPMTGDLLPCPFCGKSNQDRWPCEWLDGTGANVIRCAWCHGAAPASTWNRRTAPPSAPVGDSLLQTALRNLPQYISKSGLVGPDMHSAMQCFEVLRDALAQQPAAVDGAITGYYLATFKHKAGAVMWWGPDNNGYTPDLEQAGIYTELHPNYHDSEYTVPVPVGFIERLRVRRTVDPGDALNTMFGSAEKLRAALAAQQGGSDNDR